MVQAKALYFTKVENRSFSCKLGQAKMLLGVTMPFKESLKK